VHDHSAEAERIQTEAAELQAWGEESEEDYMARMANPKERLGPRGDSIEGYKVKGKRYAVLRPAWLGGTPIRGAFVARGTMRGRPWLRFVPKLDRSGYWVSAYPTLRLAKVLYSDVPKRPPPPKPEALLKAATGARSKSGWPLREGLGSGAAQPEREHVQMGLELNPTGRSRAMWWRFVKLGGTGKILEQRIGFGTKKDATRTASKMATGIRVGAVSLEGPFKSKPKARAAA
jgi:hypothetical protein